MKSMFSQLSKMVFTHTKRLFAVSCMLMLTFVAYAGGGWTGTATVTATVNETGRGTVYVTGTGATTTGPGESSTATKSISNSSSELTFQLQANANQRYHFVSWAKVSSSGTLTDVASTANPATGTIEGHDGILGGWAVHDPEVSYTANFERILSVTKTGQILVWMETETIIGSGRVNIELNALGANIGDLMTIEVQDGDPSDANVLSADKVKIYDEYAQDLPSTKQISLNQDGKTFKFAVGYSGTDITSIDELLTKKIKIRVTAVGNPNDRDWEDLTITFDQAKKLFFKGTNGRGTYNSNRFTSFDTYSNGIEEVTITNYDMLNGVTLSLASDPTDGEIFFAWKVTKTDGTESYISYAESCTAPDFEGGETIEAVFIPNTCGYIIMNGNSGSMTASNNRIYDNLHNALVDAQALYTSTNKLQFVVLDNMATILSNKGVTRTIREQPSTSTEASLPNREGGYTIPVGVTLLIPADNAYNYSLGELNKKFYSDKVTFAQYRKLIVEAGTQITVNGNICVFALLQYNTSAVGSYGIIELKDGSHINVNGGLYTFGYIINPQQTEITDVNVGSVGKITAQSTSTVFEVLQMTDWRGGQAASGMSSSNIFPINQYYVQSIEAPITFVKGSVEQLTTAINVTLIGTLVAHPYFILAPDTKDKDGKSVDGFFILEEGVTLTKYYDWKHDKLVCIAKGDLEQDNPIAHISSINLQLSLYSVNSADFVMPLTSNLDIRVKNLTLNLPSDMCLLAGSKLTIDENAKAILDNPNKDKEASFFVYDNEWNFANGKGDVSVGEKTDEGKGYFGQLNNTLIRLTNRPGGFNTPRRNVSEDATLLINGVAEIGEYAALYTTAEGLEGYTYGANIISTGNGRIKFGNIGDKTNTQQVTQSGTNTTPFKIPVSSARLKNANNTFVQTTDADKGKTYVYIDGVWQIPDWVLPTINITLPTQKFNGEIGYFIADADDTDEWTATLSGAGFTFDGTNTTTTITGDDITLPIRYAAQNKHGQHSATLTLTNKANASEKYLTTITATENYTPEFTATPVAPETVTIPSTYIGTYNEVTAFSGAFQIAVVDGNVTSLINDTETEYYTNISWSAESTNSQFVFTFGEGRNALSDAKITFTPTIAGSQSATITLTATYTDANSTEVINTEEVTLIVNAEAANLADNTLKLTDASISELLNMCVNVPVTLEFENKTTNTNDLVLAIENNGDPAVLTYTGDGTANSPFVVTANAIPTTMPTPTIKVTQAKDLINGIAEAVVSCETSIGKCPPNIQWNWSNMYFGYSYENPIQTNSSGDYTLRLLSIKTKGGVPVNAASVMTYSENAKKAEVKQNTGEYVATFEFSQEASDLHAAYPTTTFTANIYASPAQLSLCVTDERIFTAVNHTSSGVTFNTTTHAIDFAAGATWTMTFIGVPDILSFTLSDDTQLLIEESENGSSFGTAFYNEVVAGQGYEIPLSPSTKYVKFTVLDATSFTSLCVEKLNRVRITPQTLYMPISNDPVNSPTNRRITVTYASAENMEIHSSTSDITLTPNKLEATASGEYKVVNVIVSSAATTEYDAFLSIIHKEGGQVEVDIETFVLPQKLPIQLESGKDPAKRFHFVTTAYKNAEWDAAQYAIKMQNKTNEESNQPYVTFAFDGAPSFISFVPLVATETANWKIEESIDGTFWTPCENATFDAGVLKQPLTYTTRYVSVTYIGASAEVVQMTKVNILSDQSAIPNPEELSLTEANKYVSDLTVGKDLQVTTVNLTNLSIAIDNSNFTISYGDAIPAANVTHIANVFGEDVVGAIPFKVFWNASQATDFGTITFTTEVGGQTKTLATVPLVGTTTSIGGDETLYTGVKTGYTINGTFDGIYSVPGNDGTEYRPIDLSKTYDKNGKPLFDYLIIYGETTTTDGTTTITMPSTTVGSNAKTPIYIYVSDGTKYNFAAIEENANVANKIVDVMEVTKDQELRVYITGFCPYATTGYTKEDEGVWYFRGVNGAKLHIYLNDCYLYSRHKTVEGRAFSGRYDGQAFSEPYVRGSGGVLVLENQDNNPSGSFDVTIHTCGNNMFKSNYGCFFELMQGMRAYNVSSPLQVRLTSDTHKANSKTSVTFDDKWPTDATNYDLFDRTNGRLSLQKQHNNAPSIDLGNANTVVNFRGGQIELQNAAVVSPNYKTTFAISFRSGLMAGFPMALGIGTDDVGGEINFYDGTTTVIPMEVDIKYRDYYLMDKDANGQELSTTSCLRCPTNTRVYGGSHCMMRACADVTSKGGAPTRNGNPLGIYKYPKIKPVVEAGQTAPRGGFGEPNAVGLVAVEEAPDGYNVESVTPNTNGTDDTSDDFLNFWFTTDEESSVVPEVDKKINFWKACMTEIAAQYMSYGGSVGGPTKMLPNEETKYLLYCQLDENISEVISANDGEGTYFYQAPVKDPTGQMTSTPYLSIPPSYVGEEWQNYIETVEVTADGEIETGAEYTISEKIYYVVPATADVWMTFTAPFNVEKLWIVEAYDEAKLAVTSLKTDEDGNPLNQRQSVLLEQAKHNADFAAFFGVAMALGRDQTFDQIYEDFEGWAEYVDKKEGTRGMIDLEHYNGKNFMTANYYLYKNAGEWTRNGDKFNTQWEVVGEVAQGDTLMEQGETYSMLFPYCTGCDVQKDDQGNIVYDTNGLPIMSATARDYWDYWSGKFLIFESTQASSETPHKVKGSLHHKTLFDPASSGDGSSAIITGNSTFALMTSYSDIDAKIYTYDADMGNERFRNATYQLGNTTYYQQIQPTVSFLIADIVSPSGMPARRIMRTGEIIYDQNPDEDDNDNTQTGIPTIGGGNDLYITSIAGGINIAVAAPQYVRVISSTGALLFQGEVQTSVDVALPTAGVYVIAGETEAHKILY